MGCTSSAPIDPQSGERAKQLKTPPKESKLSTPSSANGVINTSIAALKPAATPLTAQVRREKFGVRPGYSSGASSFCSSFEDEEDDESLLLGGGDNGDSSTKLTLENGNASFSHSDILALSKLREDMVAEGDLTKTVVRIETPFGKPIEEIYDGVHDGTVLGSGVAGIVRLVVHRVTGVKYAVKCLNIGLIDSTEGLEQIRNEIFILCQLDHPNVVRIEEVYESVNEIYIVQELCVGGDLFDRLDEQTDYHYTEPQCARLVKQMLSSVRYLHSKGIIHRDLKLENFLFSSTDPGSGLKMIDFGLSKHFEIGQSHKEQVGTPYTVAPEIILGDYDEKCDLWALGVITFLLLSGETPFGGLDGEDLLKVRENIMRAKVMFKPDDVWEHVSEQGKGFVTRLLNQSPRLRPTAKEAQKDEWIQIWAKKNVKDATQLNPKTITALMSFKEQSDMQKLLSEVLSFTLLPEQIGGLRAEFEKIDTDGDGEISLQAMKRVLMDVAEGRALGALTEQEIEALFEAIQVRKSEPTIRWHEFLAAGLSQARVDDRNLRLAFDRMDSDRKGFITFSNLQNMMGNSTESGALEKIWEDSLQECNSTKLDRINYDEFKRLMKGQPKEKGALPIAGSVTDGLSQSSTHSMSSKNGAVGPNLSEVEALDQEGGDDSFRLPFKKKKSQSMGHSSSTGLWLDEEKNASGDLRDASRAVALPGHSLGLERNSISEISSLAGNRALYRKHREMRIAVLEASRQFDQKRRERDDKETEELATPSLIMRRGTITPEAFTDMHTKAMLEAAAKRCGRNRRLRNRNNSDITGMMLKPKTAAFTSFTQG